jgi:hypothetical protein
MESLPQDIVDSIYRLARRLELNEQVPAMHYCWLLHRTRNVRRFVRNQLRLLSAHSDYMRKSWGLDYIRLRLLENAYSAWIDGNELNEMHHSTVRSYNTRLFPSSGIIGMPMRLGEFTKPLHITMVGTFKTGQLDA